MFIHLKLHILSLIIFQVARISHKPTNLSKNLPKLANFTTASYSLTLSPLTSTSWYITNYQLSF
jgi:hypothetical protein